MGLPSGNKGKHLSQITKEKLRKKAIKQWQNPEYIKMMFKASSAKPTKMEIKFNSVLQEVLPSEYALNVRKEIMTLGRKIPDFVNVKGKKKIIELFGNYWHTGKMARYTEKERIDYFRDFGWDTLIIWENELKNIKTLTQKILEFNKR